MAVAIAVVLATVVPSGGGVSPTRMQELINASYQTSGTRCRPTAHGRDICRLVSEKCRGTLVVASVNASNFTIVSASPEQLDSSTCDRGENVEGEPE
jgi:hypothetical protein